MSGKVPSRVRIARTQRNTPKFAGNMNKEGLISCGFGRNRVMCQKIKSRTAAPAAPAVPVVPPDAPTNLTQLVTSVTGIVTDPLTQPTDASVKLAWTAPVNTGSAPITDYLVSADDVTYVSIGSVNTEATVDFLALSITVPVPPATQTFYIKAKNNDGGISPSVSVTLTGFTPGAFTNAGGLTALKAAIDGYLGTPQEKEAVLKAYYNIQNWDVGDITDMANAFENGRAGTTGFGVLDSTTFNEDIGGWNTINVTNMSSMFKGAEAFNRNISSWDVGNVQEMESMFDGASSFNQDLTWEMGPNLNSLLNMFKDATSFNGTLTWTQSSGSQAINCTQMFFGATDFTGLGLPGWQGTGGNNNLVRRIGDLEGMFKNAEAFNQDLSNWRFAGTGGNAINLGANGMNSIFHGATALASGTLTYGGTGTPDALSWKDAADFVYGLRVAAGTDPIPNFYENGDGYNATVPSTATQFPQIDPIEPGQWALFGSVPNSPSGKIIGDSDDDFFGQRVSSGHDGTIVAIGAPFSDISTTDSGQVQVWEWGTTTPGLWEKIADLDSSTYVGGRAGSSISLWSDGVATTSGGDILYYLAAGAPFWNNGSSEIGRVVISERTGSNTWAQKGPGGATNPLVGTTGGDGFGASVSLVDEGDLVAIGAPDNNSGYAKVYDYDAINTTWVQKGSDLTGPTPNGLYGYSISLAAGAGGMLPGEAIVAVGGIKSGNNTQGKVVISEWDPTAGGGTGDWVQKGSDLEGDATGDEFGCSISLSENGEVVAIGANVHDGSKGQVKIYYWDPTAVGGAGDWVQKGLTIDGENANDFFGTSVSLSNDGLTVAIGAHMYGSGDKGRVRVFKFIGTDWVEKGNSGADPLNGDADGDKLGISVSLSGDGNNVIIGANQGTLTPAEPGYAKLLVWDTS